MPWFEIELVADTSLFCTYVVWTGILRLGGREKEEVVWYGSG